MTSKQVLAIHSAIFFTFVAGAVSSPLLARLYPHFFSSNLFLLGMIALMVMVVASWQVFGGCPFTVWENKLRQKENKPTYLGSCIPFYAQNWFGWKLPSVVYTLILVLLLLLPIGVGVMEKFL